jgi:hypothetical protein
MAKRGRPKKNPGNAPGIVTPEYKDLTIEYRDLTKAKVIWIINEAFNEATNDAYTAVINEAFNEATNDAYTAVSCGPLAVAIRYVEAKYKILNQIEEAFK